MSTMNLLRPYIVVSGSMMIKSELFCLEILPVTTQLSPLVMASSVPTIAPVALVISVAPQKVFCRSLPCMHFRQYTVGPQ